LEITSQNGQTRRWLLLDGKFSAAAEALRARFPWQVEPTRESDLRLALPLEGPLRQGCLYAGLPTESSAPLPFHANADFYPTSDRKRIHLDGGYQAAWNEAALTAAAEVVAENLLVLRDALGPAGFWQFLQQLADTRVLAEQGDLPAIFAVYWKRVAAVLPEQPVIFTLAEEWRLPAEARLWERRPVEAAARLLRSLEIPLVHPRLAPYLALLRRPEIGIFPLGASDLAAALQAVGLSQPVRLDQAPPFLRSLDSLHALWQLVDPLLDRPQQEREQALAILAPYALVLTEAMMLERLDHTYRGGDEARALFPDIPWLHPGAPQDAFPGRFVPEFGVRQAATLLAETPLDQLERAWRLGRLDLPRLFRWFESRQIEIFGDDPGLPRLIRRLPLGPSGGALRPLADLYIPGGFSDPLGAAGLVDLQELGGRAEFLRDLGVDELTFDRYLHEQLPRVLREQADLPSDARHRLLQLLAERLGEYRDDDELRQILRTLPLIPSLDGSFRAADVGYTEREARLLLGDRAHVAEPAANKSLAALQRWLGVRTLPDAAELIAALLTIGEGTAGDRLPQSSLDQVRAVWRRLAALLAAGEIGAADLTALRTHNVIPNRHGELCRPDQVAFADDHGLARRFTVVADQLLAPDHEAAAALAAAGVRSLSERVRRRLRAPGAARLPEVEQRLVARAPLIRRVVQAELGEAAKPATMFLDDLQVWAARTVELEYELSLGDEQYASAPEPVAAGLDRTANRIYLAEGEHGNRWLALARELALMFRPEGAAGSLAITIRELLAAPTKAAATRLLDELGYPPAG
jgi:hypothetical protein